MILHAKQRLSRFKRLSTRRQQIINSDADALLVQSSSTSTMELCTGQDCQLPAAQQSQVTADENHSEHHDDLLSAGCSSLSRTPLLVADKAVQSCSIESSDKSVSTEDNFESRQQLLITISQQSGQILKNSVDALKSPASLLNNDNKQTLFYTGISTYEMFDSLVKILSPHVKVFRCLSVHDQLLIVLMKFKLAVPFQDLSYCFHVSLPQISNIFHEWLDVMSRGLTQLIVWPDCAWQLTKPSGLAPKYGCPTWLH